MTHQDYEQHPNLEQHPAPQDKTPPRDFLAETAGLRHSMQQWIDHHNARADKAEATIAGLVEALEVIAGKKQPLDNLMSNQEIARAALAALAAARSSVGGVKP